jgi:hypothetical protein
MTVRATTISLHHKLAEIRREIGPIAKTGEHTQGGPRYKFVEAVEVARRFVEMASEKNITMLPVGMEVLDIRPSITGKQHVVTLGVSWRITDADSGESIDVYGIGQGADNSDKAAPKAQTNAMKYAILLVLQAAGDDPERDDEDDEDERPRRRRSTRAPRSAPRGTEAEVEQDEHVEMASDAFKRKVRAKQREVGMSDDDMKAFAEFFTGKTTSKDWSQSDAEKILAKLDNPAAIAAFVFADDAKTEGDD